MTEKYIYADVEKPFHFWVREGKRWILREAGAHLENAPHRGNSHPAGRHPSQGRNSPAA